MVVGVVITTAVGVAAGDSGGVKVENDVNVKILVVGPGSVEVGEVEITVIGMDQ